ISGLVFYPTFGLMGEFEPVLQREIWAALRRSILSISRMRRRCSALFVLPALLAAAGCGGDQQVSKEDIYPLCSSDPGPAPLRRITRFELGRTLSDLTGVPASISDGLPPDEKTLGFDDIAAAYSVSSLHAAAYLDA